MGQESGPAFKASSLRSVERLPLGADGPASQPHASLVGSPVSFARVAPLAGGHAIGPARRSALRPRQDVVDRDRLGPRLRATVLTRVMVALGNVAPAERHGRARQPLKVLKCDDLGDRQPQPCRANARIAVSRQTLGPVAPGIQAIQVGIDDPRCVVPEQDQRPGHGRHVDGLPLSVQNQGRSIQNALRHHRLHPQETVRVPGGS